MTAKSGRLYARLLGSASAMTLLSAGIAYAEPAQFSIDPQPLAMALNAFSEQSGRAVLLKPELAEALASKGVNGSLEPEIALAEMLRGTGLTYRQTGDTFLIVQGGSADPQSGRAAGAGATVEALIVTAQKREEDIQDVPIAISAFSQEDLTRSQIAGGPDLITQVPNMTFTKTNFSSYNIQIRGIGTQAISATTDPAVAVAMNNTPFIQNRFFEQEFYDLERVEVLRGPQGTLYGRNATAGVVNIITAKPKFFFEAKLSGDVANYNSTRLEGMVNVPLVEDAVALRLAGAWTKRDGYAFNELTGSPIDGRDLWSTRVSLRVSPSSAVDMNLIWEHFEEEDDRLRSGKQLCKKHLVENVGDITVQAQDQRVSDGGLQAPWVTVGAIFSTGCERVSLYSPEAFQTPNGPSMPFYLPLGAIGGQPVFFDPYLNATQSRDLRVIESAVNPRYRASADIGEFQVDWNITDNLTLESETGYAVDEVWSTQDFNRFNTVPGAFCTRGRSPATKVCYPEGTPMPPADRDIIDRGILDEDGVFCDPQVGCSDRVVLVDLSTAQSRQFNQEFRLSSAFDGPFNFNFGVNFTRFDLDAKYYVFINHLTLAAVNSKYGFGPDQQGPYDPDNLVPSGYGCNWIGGALLGNPTGRHPAGGGSYSFGCVYVEPNSIDNIQDQGHNYFLSKNPYKLISYAAFGEAYYNITEALKVTAGLRWTVDKKEAPRIPSWTLAGQSRGYPVLEVETQEWREPTGRLAIDWKPKLAFTDETLVYASYARGYKAGGSNPPPYIELEGRRGSSKASLTRPRTFDAEFVDAFELGSKNTLADGRVTLNLAAFYYDYKDYQISEIVDRSAFNRNFDVEVWGAELESAWRPLENLKFGFKAGYQKTRIADGEEAVDLIDRTAGDPLWTVIRPFPTYPSSCILPTALFTHHGLLPQAPGEDPVEIVGLNPGDTIFALGEQASNTEGGGCEFAYRDGLDPVTKADYVADPGGFYFGWPQGTYPGWNPDWAPNNGEGIAKPLGGNELPNAPNFTGTITVDYTVPLADDWLMTLHTDLYAQSDAWWRVFNDHAYNRLQPYFTMNLAAIFTNDAAGWNVMAYVKNVTDETAITGAFLNSDDTGLTTNVFLTEPRLYGLRVTKQWTGGPLLGSFGERRDGPYPFEIELGGQVQRHDAPNAAVAPSFMDQFSDAVNPLADQQDDLNWGDGRDVKLTYRPDADWKVALGARFGKTNGAMPWSERREVAYTYYYPGSDTIDGLAYNYTISTTRDREEHTIVDFTVGKDIGLGMLKDSSVSGGLRYAELTSTTRADIFGRTNWDIPPFNNDKYAPPNYMTNNRFLADISADREFKGVGPVLSWEASAALLGDPEVGVLGLDWALSGGVLFGKRKTSITGEETEEYLIRERVLGGNFAPGYADVTTQLPPVAIHREKDVTVPTFGASLGLSYSVDRFSVGAGYRWERYADAIDGGFTETQEEDRTIDGPYLKISVGFGGS